MTKFRHCYNSVRCRLSINSRLGTNMTETSDRLWKKPQNVKDFAKSTVKKPESNEDNEVSDWTAFSNHPSWNNLFVMLENYVNRCAKLEKRTRRKNRNRGTLKKVSLKKKYKKYKKRYKLIKSETSRTSDSGYECTPGNEKQTKINYANYDKTRNDEM